jgi:hypothetical protein
MVIKRNLVKHNCFIRVVIMEQKIKKELVLIKRIKLELIIKHIKLVLMNIKLVLMNIKLVLIRLLIKQLELKLKIINELLI